MKVSLFMPDDMARIPEQDLDHFNKTLARAVVWAIDPGKQVEVYINHRNSTGWLEYGINVKSADGSHRVIFIGAIQRQPDTNSEFHS